MKTAAHCWGTRAFPFHSTDSKMLKNFLVVVIIVLVRDPNSRIVRKMNS